MYIFYMCGAVNWTSHGTNQRYQEDGAERCGYTTDRPNNCQNVSAADSPSVEKCRLYQVYHIRRVFIRALNVRMSSRGPTQIISTASHHMYSWQINSELSGEKLYRDSAMIRTYWQDLSAL